MEINKLYVLEYEGKKYYFDSIYDRNYHYNCHFSRANHRPQIEEYEIDMTDIMVKEGKKKNYEKK